jgi:hypothetical protein
MVYCPICGERNEEGVRYCTKCGESLYRRRVRRDYSFDNDLCFGTPLRGQIWGILFGAILLIWGITELIGLDINLWALVIIGFGVIIVLKYLQKPLRL